MKYLNEFLSKIVSEFLPDFSPTLIRPLGNGHINDTFAVEGAGNRRRYVLQRINHTIFRDVDLLQRNIRTVTEHIRTKLIAEGVADIDRRVLNFLSARDGKFYFFDGADYWRLCPFIEGSRTYEAVTPEFARAAGRAFGRFQAMLSDLPQGAVGETIPNFHNMPYRLQQFDEAVAADAVGRVASVQSLIDEIDSRRQTYCLQERLFAEGKLVKRINHCDTKVNNVLFDANGDTLCVIDLDTVMPGFVLSDIGDFIRTACNTAAEDEADTTKIDLNMPVFRAYAEGYLDAARTFLTPTEISLLPYGGRLMTFMQTVRFLTDHLNGDTYYKIHFPEHNLQRTRAQLALLRKLEAAEAEMEHFVADRTETF
jgi:Ser/Thr protein kinase RdoA (MazF antagonist)